MPPKLLYGVAFYLIAINSRVLNVRRHSNSQDSWGKRVWRPISEARHYPSFLLLDGPSDKLI